MWIAGSPVWVWATTIFGPVAFALLLFFYKYAFFRWAGISPGTRWAGLQLLEAVNSVPRQKFEYDTAVSVQTAAVSAVIESLLVVLGVGLAAALAAAEAVYCAFIFDCKILAALPSRNDRRVHFIHASLHELDAALRARGAEVAFIAREAAVARPETVPHPEPLASLPREEPRLLARRLRASAQLASLQLDFAHQALEHASPGH